MTPNPAERERAREDSYTNYRSFNLWRVLPFLFVSHCTPTVSLLSFIWIYVLLKVLNSLVVDKEFPLGTCVDRQRQEVIPLKNRVLVHAC